MMFFKKKRYPLDLLDAFTKYMNEGKSEKALPVIEDIIQIDPTIKTSYFNYGACLNSLLRYDDAANAYLKAYELDDFDGGALYRACLSLELANNSEMLYHVFATELEKNPYMINNFVEEEKFERFFEQDKFIKLKKSYSEYMGRDSEE